MYKDGLPVPTSRYSRIITPIYSDTSSQILQYTLLYTPIPYIGLSRLQIHPPETMRFTLPMLLAPFLLTWHQALALPSVSPFTPNTKEAVCNLPRTALYDAATHQMLGSRAVDVEATADLDIRSLQARGVPWQSAELKRRLVVGLSTAVATTIHLTNAALTWKLSLVYHEGLNGPEKITYSLY